MPSGKWNIQQLQNIVANHQSEKIGGVVVDAQTANLVVTYFNQLSEAKQAQALLIPIDRLSTLLWSVVKKS
jgi:hypothetical protein